MVCNSCQYAKSFKFGTLCFLSALISWSAPVSGHELPDGEIERRVQIVVKPDSILIEYSIGMNKATLRKQLRRHRTKPASDLIKMWKQYEQPILSTLKNNFLITIDGMPSPVEAIQASYSGWSHKHLTCLLKANVTLDSKPKKIVVSDGNFHDSPGDYRIAMKSRSGAVLERSTVPVLTGRADARTLTDLTKLERKEFTQAQGDVSLSPEK